MIEAITTILKGIVYDPTRDRNLVSLGGGSNHYTKRRCYVTFEVDTLIHMWKQWREQVN